MTKKLTLIATVLLILLAGCTGLTTYESPPAETNDTLSNEYNYEITEQEEISFEEQINIINYTQDIRISGWSTIYEKDISDELNVDNTETQSPIQFGIINTPSIKISEEELNPLSFQSLDNTINIISRETKGIEIHDKSDEFNMTHKPSTKNYTVSEYDATFTVEEIDAQFNGYVYVTRVNLDDSIAIVFGGHPNTYDEKENIIELMENIQSVDYPDS